MSALLGFSLSRPRWVLALALAASLVFGAGLVRLEIRTAGALLEPEGDPAVEARRSDAQRFGDRREILLVVTGRNASGLASREGMQALRALDAALRGVPDRDPADIRSVASLPRTSADAGRIELGRALDRIPEAPDALARWLAELRAPDAGSAPLLSSDGSRALVVAAVADGVGAERAVGALAELRDRLAPGLGLEVWIGGPLVAETMLGSAVLRDLATLIPLMLLVILALLAATVRSPAGLMIPMLEIALVLVWTFGAMGWLGVPVTLVTTALPVVLMAMCIADEIHFLERLQAQPAERSVAERIRLALGDVARPIVLTSLTTAAAFLSFLGATVAPLRSFGCFTAFGILAALLFTFSVVPALSVLLPRSLERFGAGARPRRASRVGAAIAAHPGRAFALGALGVAVMLPGLARLEVSDSWVANFSPGDEIVRAAAALDDSFWGAYRLDLVFEGEQGLFLSPRGIRLLDEAARRAAGLDAVGGVESPLDRLSGLARGIGETRPLSALSSGEIFDLTTLAGMLPGGVGLAGLLSEDGRFARLRLYVRHADHRLARRLQSELDAWLPALAEAAGARLRLGGELTVAAATVDSLVANQLRSIAWTLASLFALLYLFAGSVRAWLSLVPPCVATLALLGAMGWGGMELGVATSMFASIAVGVGVDFGIHLQHRFERVRRSGDAAGPEAVARTLAVSGRALAWNASVLAGGFLVLLFSALRPNHSFGLLLAAAMLACYAASLLLLPRLLLVGASALLLALPLAAAPAAAAEAPCPAEESPALARRMRDVEQAVRSKPRLARMVIEASYGEQSGLTKSLGGPPAPKTLWSAVRHDGDATWLLYVFSGPGRLAGTSLLLRDHVAADVEDDTWFYLRAFDSFQKLEGAVEQTVVPGSVLSYEDARGFVATSRYRFHEAEPGESGRPRVLACPRTPELAERLGYGRLYIELDPERPLVRRIDYRGLGGAPLKVYELEETAQLDGSLLPKRVRLHRLADGFENRIGYEYWAPGAPLPDRLFSTNPARDGSFASRLQQAARAAGVGERLDEELARAQALVDAYERRTKAGAPSEPATASE